jgi:hypothetical protein
MQSNSFETGWNYTPRFHHQKIIRSFDSPAKAGGLAYRLHPPALHILPLRLHAVKGRKLSPLTACGFTAFSAQRDGSGGSRQATDFSNQVGHPQAFKASFRKEDQLHFLQCQQLEEVDEAHHEFESPS